MIKYNNIHPSHRIHQFSLEEYIGVNPRIVTEFGPQEHAFIYETNLHLKYCLGAINAGLIKVSPIETTIRDDFRFFMVTARVLLITDLAMKNVAGGMVEGTLTIFEDYRGAGLARDIHLVLDEAKCVRFFPEYYSAGGHATRMSAHRAACLMAHNAGADDIHPDNLQAYALCCGPAP